MSVPVAKTAAAVLPQGNLDRLRQKGQTLQAEQQRLRAATKEFESFFTYYLMKEMRKTVPESALSGGGPLSGSSGKDIFTDLFDMEIARNMSLSRGRSLSDMLYRAMEPLIEAEFGEQGEDAPDVFLSLPTDTRGFTGLARSTLPVDAAGSAFRDLPLAPPGGRPLRAPADTERRIATEYGAEINRAAKRHNLDPALILAVIKTESNGEPKAVSEAGAKGLMQLMDGTAEEMGVRDVFDPTQNIEGGSRYLREMLDRYDGDKARALAAYNAGPTAVDKHDGVPPYRETKEYVTRVLDTLRRIRGPVTPESAKVR